MSESEFFICKQCGKEHEALTQEIASYTCPNQPKLKRKLKVLDEVREKYLTDLNGLRQPQDPNLNYSKDGEQYGDESTTREETEEKLSSDRNARVNEHETDDRSIGTKSGQERL